MDSLKLRCERCNEDVNVNLERSGPHIKASCSQCKHYIKFLGKHERLTITGRIPQDPPMQHLPWSPNDDRAYPSEEPPW